MYDFYVAYYRAVETSQAHARFCEYAYGENLCQHGFMTGKALDFLMRVTRWSVGERVLDVGCGNGKIAHRIARATGAEVYGIDYIGAAIEQAHRAMPTGNVRTKFFVADLNRLPCAPHFFDALLSIDSLYFSENYTETLDQWVRCTKIGGHLAIFFSHGANPAQPRATFDRATLPSDKTPVGVALQELGMSFEAWDFTADDYELARRKKEILEKLKDDFLKEGNRNLYENRLGEALGVIEAVESGMHARYLYEAF